MARSTRSHERIMQILFKVRCLQMIEAVTKTILHNDISGQRHEAIAHCDWVASVLVFCNVPHQLLNLFSNNTLKFRDAALGEERIQCGSSHAMNRVWSRGENGTGIAEAIIGPVKPVCPSRLDIEGIKEVGIVHVKFVRRNTDDWS